MVGGQGRMELRRDGGEEEIPTTRVALGPHGKDFGRGRVRHILTDVLAGTQVGTLAVAAAKRS